jgi:hypothetical protein
VSLVAHRARLIAPIVMIAVLAGACGGGGGQTASVASLDDLDGAGASAQNDQAAAASSEDVPLEEVSGEDALLAYAECMRAEGMDFPDPTFDSDGRPSADSFRGNREQDGFDAANEVCQVELEGAAFGGPRGNDDFRATLEDGMLAYTECLRGEGLQVDDFQLGDPGAGGPGADGGPPEGFDPNADGGPDVQRGQGDPSAFIGRALGLDTGDPAVQAALEVCQPVLTDIVGAGPGQ